MKKNDGATKRFIGVCTIPTFVLYLIFVIYPIFNMIGLSLCSGTDCWEKRPFMDSRTISCYFKIVSSGCPSKTH